MKNLVRRFACFLFLSVLMLSIFVQTNLGVENSFAGSDKANSVFQQDYLTPLQDSSAFAIDLNKVATAYETNSENPKPQVAQAAGNDAGLNGTYSLIWEPNRIQGSTHCVAVYKSIVAIGAGYLYDNEIHIYKWDSTSQMPEGLTHAWDIGSNGILRSDILSLAFGDTDKDGLVELVAGCADGKIFVFEQKDSDPTQLSYYAFRAVWNSTETKIDNRITGVQIEDLDSDGQYEIAAGSWTRRVYVFKYSKNIGAPLDSSHRHEYDIAWDSGDQIAGLVNSIAVGDTDADSLKEIIVGASDGKVYIFENYRQNGENKYILVWNSSDTIRYPIRAVAVYKNLDSDAYGEIAVIAAIQGLYIFDFDPATGSYKTSRGLRALESWEKDSPYPIDHYIDLKVQGNSTEGVFEPQTHVDLPNLCPYGLIPKPYEELGLNGTAVAGPPDMYLEYRNRPPFFAYNVALLNATMTPFNVATVTLDFGKDEEITGGGNSLSDLNIEGFWAGPKTFGLTNLGIYISQNNTEYNYVNSANYLNFEQTPGAAGTKTTMFHLSVDLDPTLKALNWESFRYIKLVVKDASVYIDSIEGVNLYRPVLDGETVCIGSVSSLSKNPIIVVGTTTGALKAFSYNGSACVQIWDSCGYIPGAYRPGTDEPRARFSMGNNIWSLSVATEFSGLSGNYGNASYVVAGTNPKVAFIQIDAHTLEASAKWDTGDVLAKWTQSVCLKDIDEDGAKEVVVGSFDNTLYIFDHVYLNTYRIAWRSPSLTHNEGQLTFWDHATDVSIGNWDGANEVEIVVSTNNQTIPAIYVFKLTTDNTFEFSETIKLPKNSGPIAVAELAQDLDHDGANEIVAATGRTVYIVEKKNGANTISNFQVTNSSSAQITALLTGDTDKDNLGEIIVGGYDTMVSYSLGFVTKFENYQDAKGRYVDDKYAEGWKAPSGQMNSEPDSPTQMQVLSLTMDDQDKDGRNEIYVGHTYGINVYEVNSSPSPKDLDLVQIITSSASYGFYMYRSARELVNNYSPDPTPNATNGVLENQACTVQLPNGNYVMVFTSLDTSPKIDKSSGPWTEIRLFYSTSTDGITWSAAKRVTDDSWYTDPWQEESTYYPYYECDPSLAVTSSGEIQIAYEARIVSGEMPVIRSSYVYASVIGLTSPTNRFARVSAQLPAVSPSLFWNPVAKTMDLAFINCTDPSNRNLCTSRLTHSVAPIGNVNAYIDLWSLPVAQCSYIGKDIQPISLQAVALPNGNTTVVFDGYNKTKAKITNATEIWLTSGSQSSNEWYIPRPLSLSEDNEYCPSIAVLRGNVLACVYQRFVAVEGSANVPKAYVYITASADGGFSWTTPQRLPKPTGAEMYAPSVSALRDGGYLCTYCRTLEHSGSVFTVNSPQIWLAKNPLENWWLYSIGQVQALTVGNTEDDSANEVVAGCLNQLIVLKTRGLFDKANLYQTYANQTWTSETLLEDVTAVVVGDINKDAINEIVATAQSGNLYAFEWQKQSPK